MNQAQFLEIQNEVATILSSIDHPVQRECNAISKGLWMVQQAHVGENATQELADQVFVELTHILGGLATITVERYKDVSITVFVRSFRGIMTIGNLTRLS